jgi:hypothetical protein
MKNDIMTGKNERILFKQHGEPFLYKTLPSYWNFHPNHHANPLNEFIITYQGSELNLIGRMMGM